MIFFGLIINFNLDFFLGNFSENGCFAFSIKSYLNYNYKQQYLRYFPISIYTLRAFMKLPYWTKTHSSNLCRDSLCVKIFKNRETSIVMATWKDNFVNTTQLSGNSSPLSSVKGKIFFKKINFFFFSKVCPNW